VEEAIKTDSFRATASGVVSKSPCFVSTVSGLGLAQASNVYTIYDGHNTEGKVKMRLAAGQYSSDFRLFVPAMYFAKGVYVDFTTNGEECVVQFKEVG